MQDVQAKKDFVCSTKYPEYTKRSTSAYSYRPATCTKKPNNPRSKKMQIRQEIQSVVDELVAQGVSTRNIDTVLMAAKNNAGALASVMTDVHTLAADTIVDAAVYKCAIDILPEFMRNPLPVKENASNLIKKWMQPRGLKSNPPLKLGDVIMLELLSHALQFHM